jgi:hypothetical protein
MRPLRTLPFCFAAALLVGAPGIVVAQDAPTLTLAVGVSWLRDETARAPGGAADVAWRLMRLGPASISVAGDVGVNRFEGATVTSYLAGVRVSSSVAKIRPYGQVLFGVERCCDEGASAIQMGGGADVPFHRNMAVRVAYDYRRASYDQAVFNEHRVWFGLAVGR